MTNTIPLSVVVDGETVIVPGWMYVLAFALRGIPWAIEQASKPEFQVVTKDYLAAQRRHQTEREIQRIEGIIADYQAKIEGLRRDLT